VNVYSKLYAFDIAPVTTSGSSADRLGWITVANCPQRPLHQFELVLGDTARTTVAEIEGIEVEYEVMGDR